MKQVRGLGWWVIFAVLVLVAFAGFYYFTGRDALGATARIVWNACAFAFNGVVRFMESLVGLLARGVGLRRLSRLAAVVAGIGLGYAGSLLLSDKGVHAARDWKGKVIAFFAAAGARWRALPLYAKLLIVVVLIASQVYLHTVLILFPIAFLVPLVRNLWVQTVDILFGDWYWKTFGTMHHRIASRLRRLPIIRGIVGGVRLMRIRYLCAWRLWRYDPHYRVAGSQSRRVNFVEPIQLWRHGELDRYVGHPLLAGTHRNDTPSGDARNAPSQPPCPRSPPH